MDKFKKRVFKPVERPKKICKKKDIMFFTCGIGQKHLTIAKLMADRFYKLNGYRVEIIKENRSGRHPAFMKAFIWDFAPKHINRIVWIDADIVPMREMPYIPDDDFSVVQDVKEWVKCKHPYFNTGFFVCTRKLEGLFNKLKKYSFQEDGFYEQTPFNLLIQKYGININYLDPKWNYIPMFIFENKKPPEDVIHFHLAGNKKPNRFHYKINQS